MDTSQPQTPSEGDKKGPTAFDELEEQLSEIPPIDVGAKGAAFGKVVLVSLLAT